MCYACTKSVDLQCSQCEKNGGSVNIIKEVPQRFNFNYFVLGALFGGHGNNT